MLMNKKIFLTSIFFTTVCLSSPKEEIIGFDKPFHITKVKLGKSDTTEDRVEFSCWVYKGIAVAQIIDPGSMGAKDIEIRYIDPSKSLKQVCTETKIGSGTQLKNFYGYFVGSRDGFVFIDEPDTFGGQQSFQVFFKDGKEVLREVRDSSESLTIKTAKATSITYYKGLDVKCPLAIESSKCWQKVISDNNIPISLKLQMPNCETSFKNRDSSLNNNSLVSTKVEIADLSHPVIKYLGGNVTCTRAP